ncbi:MFS transporter [Nonomuraea africana]|uniref:MFS family arabinose efflux permease n=1 Tax=Nonomuraea africana TaxID=46171 RepID=A0ABR9KAA3_9ACTN|nr:MFS transporter [Nonomuraea africana]MBE1558944.1 putative MFS family arabinose efflux permease [Nonomuraea africana]
MIVAQLLPSGVLGAFVGPVADRLPKRVLLIGSDLARVLIVLAMIPALGSAWLLLVLIFLEGVGKAFFETARIAAIPKIVGRHSIPSAVALFQSTSHTINLLGPALGGLLVAVGSVPVVLMIDAATFLLSAALLGSMAVLRELPSGPREPYWGALRAGVRGVLGVPSLRHLALFLVPAMLVLGLFTTNFNAQLLTVFQLPALSYGLAQALFGGGSILGALLGPALLRRYPDRLLAASIVVFGLSLLALAPAQWSGHLAVIGLWCLLTGLGSGLFQVPVANTLLRDLPEDLRGRGVALLNAVMVNFTIAGVVAGSLVAEVTGVAASIIGSGALLLGAAGLLSLRYGRQPEGHPGHR